MPGVFAGLCGVGVMHLYKVRTCSGVRVPSCKVIPYKGITIPKRCSNPFARGRALQGAMKKIFFLSFLINGKNDGKGGCKGEKVSFFLYFLAFPPCIVGLISNV